MIRYDQSKPKRQHAMGTPSSTTTANKASECQHNNIKTKLVIGRQEQKVDYLSTQSRGGGGGRGGRGERRSLGRDDARQVNRCSSWFARDV